MIGVLAHFVTNESAEILRFRIYLYDQPAFGGNLIGKYLDFKPMAFYKFDDRFYVNVHSISFQTKNVVTILQVKIDFTIRENSLQIC